MSLFRRLERRLSRWAIPNLVTILVMGQAALYVLSLMPGGIPIDRITLDPAKAVAGEPWRLVTFLIAPPQVRPIAAIFYFALLNMFGTVLEKHWGPWRLNVFLFIGYVANIVAAFLAAALVGSTAGGLAGGDPTGAGLASIAAPNGFLYGSLFLAFARLYPNFIINLFYVLPIQVKWLALAAWVTYGYWLVRGDWPVRLAIAATLLNYVVFFGREHLKDAQQSRRRRSFQAAAKKATSTSRHTCRVCGLSSDASPKTLFRYCTKCAGQACYCPDHIRDHEHVAEEAPAGAGDKSQ